MYFKFFGLLFRLNFSCLTQLFVYSESWLYLKPLLPLNDGITYNFRLFLEELLAN